MSLPTAIEFLALVAYPESAARRARAEQAMRAYYLRCCKEAGTLERLGKVPQIQQMEGQFRRLKERIRKRIAAAEDCVSLTHDLAWMDKYRGTTTAATLNSIAIVRPKRYKTDWWRPEVMHLAIVLRGIHMGWKFNVPFCPETLILTWPAWIDSAIHNATPIALELAHHSNPALAGFRRTTFLFPNP